MRRSSTIFLGIGVVVIAAVSAFLLFLLFLRPEAAPELPSTSTPLAIETMAPDMATAVATQSPESLPTATAVAPTDPNTYTVQAGDTLFSIAQNHGLTVEELMALNNLTTNIIYPGDVLLVRDSGSGTDDQGTGGSEPESNLQSLDANPQTPDPTPAITVNSIPLDQIVVMDDTTRQNVITIYAKGQQLGRNPQAFSKVGDSTIEAPHFLERFDIGPYNLGDYAYLQAVIDYYAGSFARDSASVRIGLHSWTVFDPMWADKAMCQPSESSMECETRLHNPSIVFIRLGSNDVAGTEYYATHMRQIVEYAIQQGIIPVLGTKADRHEGSDANNGVVRQLTAEYHIPLWDFDRIANTLPNRGLDVDGVHMNTYYAHDYSDPTAFTRGHAMHNLTALMVLDVLKNTVTQ